MGLIKSRTAAVWNPVRFSTSSNSFSTWGRRGSLSPGARKRPSGALVRWPTVTWLSRNTSLTNCTSVYSECAFGRWPNLSVQADHGLPNSSGYPIGLYGLVLKPTAELAGPGPCETARSCVPLRVLFSRIMCSWRSKTKRSRGGPISAAAAGSNSSAGSTSKKRPNTSFMAINAAAMPPDVARNLLRLMFSFLDAVAAMSAMRASTSFCFVVCAKGMYSPFETIAVGMGERRLSPSSALATAPSCASENHESSSRSGKRSMCVVLIFVMRPSGGERERHQNVRLVRGVAPGIGVDRRRILHHQRAIARRRKDVRIDGRFDLGAAHHLGRDRLAVDIDDRALHIVEALDVERLAP